jgi:hypothetical protein
MKPAELGRELIYPLSSITTLVPMVISWLLFSVATFFGLFGLFLFITTGVPFFGYLMSLLEARSNNKAAPAFDAELMALIGNGWALFPLVIVVFLGWIQFAVSNRYSADAALLLLVFSGALFPASLGVFSITRSPLQGLNLVALLRFIQSAGVDYAQLLGAQVVVTLVLYLLLQSGAPWLLVRFGLIYQAFLLYGMTGSIVGAHRLVDDVHIPAPQEASVIQSRTELINDRQSILTHAYGFASRGNRAGGLAHIQSQIDGEPDQDEAYQWFFNEMLKWENPDAALFFAQAYLHRLLGQEREPSALKLLSQCFHANPRFRPADDDRENVVEIAERHGRQDLLKQLG